MSNFKDKVVVITGASQGVGAACARLFAKQGAKLVLSARGIEGLQNIQAELEALSEGSCEGLCEVSILSMDVGSASQCSELIEHALSTFGTIDVLINNAGFHSRGDFITRTSEDMVSMVDINLRAPIQLSSEALPHITKGGGAIVMVGSLAGRAPLQGAATYSSTKAGLRTFALALADEFRGANVHIGLVSPGPINTGFIMDNIDEVEDIVYSQGMSTAEEVALAVEQIALGKKVEIAMPKSGGVLTHLSYLFPVLRRLTRPLLYKIGRKNKARYRKAN